MLIRKTMMCLIAAITLICGAATAQECAEDTLIKELLSRIDKLEARVAELEGARQGETAARITEPRPVTPAPAAETPKPAAPEIKISGEGWFAYSYDMDGADKNDNEFTMDRVYLDFKRKVGDRSEWRFTSDIRTTNSYRDSGGDTVSTGRFDVFAKHAYMTFKDIVKGGSLIAGQQPTPWPGFEDGFWRYRPVGKSMSDRWGYMDSSDFGVSLQGKLQCGTDYHLMVANGEGYGSREETNNKNGKNLSLKMSRPIGENLPTFGIYAQSGSKANDDSNRIGALIGKSTDMYHYGLNYIKGEDGATDSRAYSLYGGTAFTGTRWAWFARYDNYDPDTDVSNNLRKLTIFGFSYKINPETKLYIGRLDQKIQNGTDDTDISAILHLKY